MAPDATRTAEGQLRVALLGSTGSIGRQALEVIEALSERFRVTALAAGRDAARFSEQVARLQPAAVSLADETALRALDLPFGTRAETGPQALASLATRQDVDLVLVATGGLVSLGPVLAALEAGKVVATANKETLVAGGHLVMPLARARAARVAAERPADPFASPLAWLRPIDSEHSAIWQCLAGERPADVARLVLTASGGPFRGTPRSELATVRPADALAHPTWRMGAKVTIDSATLMNKGLEVIEARWLYDVPDERIDVVVHPQSVVHSAVEFVDGSLKAQLGHPDMRIPIQYALTYPERAPSPAASVALAGIGRLDFEALDEARFPAVQLARDAFRSGPRATAALIAADEVAVERFLGERLSFPGITALVAAAVERFADGPAGAPDVAGLLELESEVRAFGAAWTEV
ncbi:MAG TPA: 1-deoxy-D-xylulose-5-phosphate reductoisomerase [Candidatus Limnocylindrales bacterium]|nr:1-deoxy-D-xylulose-5-phosphate reductoisomerase [Candidatus Limnocylindrales bacterium]